MKYKVGDTLYYNKYGAYASCKVVGLLEKTTRYRVEYDASWMGVQKTDERMMPERDLFPSIAECIDSEIEGIKKEMEKLHSKIALLRQKKEESMKAKVTDIPEQGATITETPKPASKEI